jgi:dephospho-CoA kinase
VLTLKKVAVTGGLASGKSSVCRILQSLGAYVISADAIVHELLSSNFKLKQQIIEKLGAGVLTGDQLDRKKIAQIVFKNPEQLDLLEQLIYPLVFHEIDTLYKKIKDNKQYRLFVVEIPLLFESGTAGFYDAIVAVVADENTCRKRFHEAGHPLEEYDQRMRYQLTPEEKAARADYIIVNDGNLDTLKKHVLELNQEL